MWSRAQVFVANKTSYRFQVISESIIQTAGPLGSMTDLAFLLTRELRSDGSGLITMRSACGRTVSCLPSPALAGRQFVEYLSAVP